MRHPHEIRALLSRADRRLRPLDLLVTAVKHPAVLHTVGLADALRWALGGEDEPDVYPLTAPAEYRHDDIGLLVEVAEELKRPQVRQGECHICGDEGKVVTVALFGRYYLLCRGNSGRARRPCWDGLYAQVGAVCFGCGEPTSKKDRRAGLCASCTAVLRKERRGTY